jgi:SNF2 family DNA or RNA helicase
MPITKLFCPVCKGPAETVYSLEAADSIFRTYKCGHVDSCAKISPASYTNFVSADGKKPYPFQIAGAVFATETANGVFLIMDEQGLGKTVQVCMAMWSHPKELTKFLILCKAGLKVQWSKEIPRWCGDDWVPQIVEKETDFLGPVKGFILSFDTLWRFKDIEAWIKRARVKFVCIDEVQHIKNTDSKRTNGVRKACTQVQYRGGLSGTPIRNHAGEFFPILNILRPDIYRTKSGFDQIHVDIYFDGYRLKYGGLKDPTRFRELNKDFVIRRTREEVLPDLPVITRNFLFSELGPVVEQAYKDTFKQFQYYYLYGSADVGAAEKAANILAYLTKMRHLTGIAKIEPCVDFVQDFVENTDRKLVIFAHHKDVRKILWEKLEEMRTTEHRQMSPILLLPENADARPDTVDAFWRPEYRIMIASSLASSEGLNLQCCSDCVTLERQWTPSSEEQAEGRFIRIGQKANKVTNTFLIAVGTVDEFFAKLVEQKREICAQTIDGKEISWQESSLIKELAEVLAQQGGKKWGW